MAQSATSMSLRELKDTMKNLQVEWPTFLHWLPQNPNAQAKLANLKAGVALLDQCCARFGALCLAAGDKTVMLTVCTFMIFYLHLHLLAVARPAPDVFCYCWISKYHMGGRATTSTCSACTHQ
jgi:hypothetical protein